MFRPSRTAPDSLAAPHSPFPLVAGRLPVPKRRENFERQSAYSITPLLSRTMTHEVSSAVGIVSVGWPSKSIESSEPACRTDFTVPPVGPVFVAPAVRIVIFEPSEKLTVITSPVVPVPLMVRPLMSAVSLWFADMSLIRVLLTFCGPKSCRSRFTLGHILASLGLAVIGRPRTPVDSGLCVNPHLGRIRGCRCRVDG